MKTKFPINLSVKGSNVSTTVILDDYEGTYIVALANGKEIFPDKSTEVSANADSFSEAFVRLNNNLKAKGCHIISVNGIPEIEKNETINYMFKYFSEETGIEFKILYRNRFNPEEHFGGKYTRNYIAVNVNDDLDKLNYMLLVGELRGKPNEFGGLLLNERTELLYKIDSAATPENVKELGYTYIEQFIGEPTNAGFSYYDPSLKKEIDNLRQN